MKNRLAFFAFATICAVQTHADGIQASSDDIGKVIASNGNVYDSVSAASAAGTTAQAMIAYVDADNAVGLAIALNDIKNSTSTYTWDDAMNAVPNWAASRAVPNGFWRMPTVDDWKHMFQGCGGTETSSDTYRYGYFRTKLNACGGSDTQGSHYWTATEMSSTTAWAYNFYTAYLGSFGKSNTYLVRACLEFDIQSDTAGRTGDCRWRYDADTRTLTIYGSGAMADYSSNSRPPWVGLYASDITNVVLQSGVTAIGDFAFATCTALLGVSMPGSVTDIGDFAFHYCNSLPDMTIGDAVVSVGIRAFFACHGLKTVTIPASTTSIGSDAFWGCDAVTDVHCHSDPAKLAWNEDGCDDFMSRGATRCHVKSGRLAAFRSKFGGVVNVTFVGDIPYSSFAEWANENGVESSGSGIVATADDVNRLMIWTKYGRAMVVSVDEKSGTGLAVPTDIDQYWNTWVGTWSEAMSFSDSEENGVWRIPTYDEMTPSLAEWYCFEQFWTATEVPGDDAAYIVDYGVTGPSRTKSTSETLHYCPVFEFKATQPQWKQTGTAVGQANVFAYAFNMLSPDYSGAPVLDIAFDANGRAVIKTPPVVNTAGFAYSVVASDDVAGKINVVDYPLAANGTNVIDEASTSARFFRLKAEDR